MLVYEKKVNNQTHLYGTLENVPSGEDTNLIYKDINGTIITPTPTLNKSYFDNGMGGIIDEEGEEIQVFIETTRIIPSGQVVDPPVEVGTFSISTDEYEFEVGMTFAEWVNSEYNTDSYEVQHNNIVKNSKVISYNDEFVPSTEEITDNQEYSLKDDLVSFYIADVSYTLEAGMTWEQWVPSTYNTGGYIIPEGGTTVTNGNQSKIVALGSTPVNNTETITTGEHYILAI